MNGYGKLLLGLVNKVAKVKNPMRPIMVWSVTSFIIGRVNFPPNRTANDFVAV